MSNLIDKTEENPSTPVTLSLRDVILILAAVISMVTAWGMFGTRLSIVEEKTITINKTIIEVRGILKEIKAEHNGKEGKINHHLDIIKERLRNIENTQAQITGILSQNKNIIK